MGVASRAEASEDSIVAGWPPAGADIMKGN